MELRSLPESFNNVVISTYTELENIQTQYLKKVEQFISVCSIFKTYIPFFIVVKDLLVRFSQKINKYHII